MNTKEKLLVSAIAGLVTVGMTASPALADSHSPNADTTIEKSAKTGFWSRLFGSDENSVKSKDSCKSKDGCPGRE